MRPRIRFEVVSVEEDVVQTEVYTGSQANISFAGDLVMHRTDWMTLHGCILRGANEGTRVTVDDRGITVDGPDEPVRLEAVKR